MSFSMVYIPGRLFRQVAMFVFEMWELVAPEAEMQMLSEPVSFECAKEAPGP